MVEKISVEIALVGGPQVEKQLADVTKSFDNATKSIAALGTTGAQALNAAAAAAQKFGATAPELQKVESVINALAARAKDSNVPFSQLATNYDNARANAGKFGAAVAEVTKKVASFHPELAALSAGMSAVGLPFGGLVSALSRLGSGLGPVGIAVVAFGAAAATAAKFTLGLADAITKVNAEAAKLGLPVEKLDRWRLGFEKAGVSQDAMSDGLKHFQDTIQQTRIDRLNADLETLQGLQKRGFALTGLAGARDELKRLQITALEAGKAGDFAREALVKLGQPIPKPPTEGLKQASVDANAFQQEMLRTILTLEKMPPGVEQTNLAIEKFGQKLGVELIGVIRTGGPALEQLKQQLRGLGEGGITQEQVDKAVTLEQALNRLAGAWGRFGSLSVSPAIVTGIDAITTSLGVLDGLLVRNNWSAFGTAASLALNPLPTLVQLVTAALLEQAPVLGKLIDQFLIWIGLKEKAGGMPLPGGAGIGGPGGGIGRNASGGLLGGRGTGTSDSNLAWVSRGEHIMPARSVAQPGMLALLEALRRSGGNLRGVLDGMGRFALGGMVPRAMPAFAGGGLVGSQSRNLGILTLQVGGETVSGLTDARIAEALGRVAVRSQVRSGGRKPSRYG